MINLPCLAPGKLRGEGLMRGIVLGHYQAAAGVLVQPVHDARAGYATDARELSIAVVQQRIDQRPS